MSVPGDSVNNLALDSYQEKTADKPKLRDILQNNFPVLFKNIKVKKHTGRLRNSSREKETKEM